MFKFEAVAELTMLDLPSVSSLHSKLGFFSSNLGVIKKSLNPALTSALTFKCERQITSSEEDCSFKCPNGSRLCQTVCREQWDEEVKAEVSGRQHISHICQRWVAPEEIAHKAETEDLPRLAPHIL